MILKLGEVTEKGLAALAMFQLDHEKNPTFYDDGSKRCITVMAANRKKDGKTYNIIVEFLEMPARKFDKNVGTLLQEVYQLARI